MNHLRAWYCLLWAGYGGTLACFVLWAMILPNLDAEDLTLPWYAIFILPLLLPLPGLVKRSAYVIAGTSMLCIFYLAFAMMEAVAGSPFGMATSLFSALWFVASMFFVRLAAQKREAEESAIQ